MKRGAQGSFRTQLTPPENFKAFIPSPLPPKPPLQQTAELTLALSRANLTLGRLDGISRILPSVELLLYFYTRREAVLSSQIEGTQTTFSEFLLFELAPDTIPNNLDIQEVSNYVVAMQHGLQRLADGFPLSLRLLREIHEQLLRSGRGSEKDPGEFRRGQNWIGGTRPGNAAYVPPPVPEMLGALDAFEKFLHGEAAQFPVLVQAALLHAQFETVHPFLDGNGRLGRLLITLLLVERGVLMQPLLYLSLFFKQHRDEYFAHLQAVRTAGTWEEWVLFFLTAVEQTSERAVQLAHDVLNLLDQDRERLKSLGSRSQNARRVFDVLRRAPFVSATEVSRLAEISFPSALAGLRALADAGLLTEITGQQRGRIYRYDAYVSLLSQGA